MLIGMGTGVIDFRASETRAENDPFMFVRVKWEVKPDHFSDLFVGLTFRKL